MCIERVLSMVNDLVYTDVALHSCGYIEAADNVVRVAASNPLTYAAIKASAITMRVVGVSIIGGCGTFLSYQALSSTELHRQLDLVFQDASTMLVTSNILGTTIAAGLICFYVGLAFMMVFYQTTYSLMYCMLLTGDGGQGEELKGREFQTRLPGEKM
ncbi:Glutathione S-transferase Mu 2 [Durusdinium trenchii]